jgi:hypothetical protein
MKLHRHNLQEGEVAIVVPLTDAVDITYVPRKLQVPFQSPTDAGLGRVAARVRDALRNRHEQLRGGRHVESIADTVRWMLERVDDATRPTRKH